MKITNNSNLPQSVFEALSRNEYSREGADISVTELIDSPRVRVLKKLHDDKIEMEAESLLASFLGTCFHKGIESGTKTGTAERRLSIKVNGWTLSGGMDHWDQGVLTDYKTATTWKTKLDCADGRIEEWENQLNVYAQILRENGVAVTKLMLFCLFKDWNRGGLSQAVKSNKIFVPYHQGGYPDKAWVYFEIPLWDESSAKRYIQTRVELHQEAEKTLPLCTNKEIWRGSRCKSYCAAAPFCDQFKESSKTGLINEE